MAVGAEGVIMLPEKLLSSEYVPGVFLPPDGNARRPLHDYEMGGIALQNPTQGLMVQAWHCYYNLDESAVFVEAPSLAAPIKIFDQVGISELSFCFDQNMRWSCVYKLESGGTEFRWYDSQQGKYVITDLAAGIVTPFLALDDKRPNQLSASDMILTYLRGSTLYFRAQRDRFLIEYPLAESIKGSISNFGMNNKLRMEWTIFTFDPVAEGFN